jgi:signal transduction histidine kinase
MHLIHDLRLVLAAIAACLRTLRENNEGQPLPREIDHASRMLDTGFAIVEELLVNPTQTPPNQYIEVNPLLGSLDAVMGTIVGPDVKLRTTLGAAESRIFARPVDLERILLNVVFNAAAAMPDGGTLSIDTELTQSPVNALWTDASSPFGQLRVTIRDTGRGMDGNQLVGVLNPMATPRKDGTGLGLASVLLILTRLGGTVAIESEPDKGTAIVLTLPLSPPLGGQVH